jgi:hypothetical protein
MIKYNPHPSRRLRWNWKKAIEAEVDFKRVPLDPMIPDRAVSIGTNMSPREQTELLQFLNKNSDVFAWFTFDLVGVSREVIEQAHCIS